MLRSILKKLKSALKVCGILISNFPRLIRLAPKILTSGGHLSINVTYVKYEALLNDKRIIVTGGGSGIGLAIAQKALDLGAVVLITGRNFHKLEKVANTISNPNLRILAWDVSETEKLSSHLTEAKDILGGEVDILVNNAGVLSKGLFPNVKEEDWEQVYDINSKGLFFLTQEICRIWLKQNTSTSSVKKVINISSQGGYVGATYPYRMTKWDIAGLTQGLGISLAPKNIIVNGIAPGIISTEMQKKFLKQRDNSYCDLNPQNRIASPEEIAELAAFLLSDASNFIVGQTIICDGGFSLK